MTAHRTTAAADIWDPTEQLPREELAGIQLARLQEVVRTVSRVPFYRDALAQSGVQPEDIQGLDDVRRLPLTTKEDLRQNYPLGMLAVPREQIARIHGSSGTTGKPTLVAYTHEDLVTWSELCARFLVAGGLRAHHLVHIAFGYGLFTGGFGLHYGVERVGAAIVPVAAGNTARQILLLGDLAPDVLICTPSYALNIAEVARAEGIDPLELNLKYGHFGGEPWTEDMRFEIERQLGIQAFNNYGLSEVMGPGVSGECSARKGMHLQEDHFLVECLDPETLEPVEDGKYGELVITNLTKRAMPLLRYRTRDLACLSRDVCECGRTTTRMSRVIGRTDDMLIVRGVNLFPSQIEEALLRVDGTAPHYLIQVDRPGTMDQITVRVELKPEFFSDKMSQMQALRERIGHEIYSVTGIHAKIDLVEPHTIERSQGKAKRVDDRRPPVERGWGAR